MDPENPSDVYMAFEYYYYGPKHRGGSCLARSKDYGKSYTFLSWMSPLGYEDDPNSGATYEPAIEYLGNRTPDGDWLAGALQQQLQRPQPLCGIRSWGWSLAA